VSTADWLPTALAMQQLRADVLLRCGVRSEEDRWQEKQRVIEHLTRWFAAEGLPQPAEPIEHHATFLLTCEGSGGMFSWEGAVQHVFPGVNYYQSYLPQEDPEPRVLLEGMGLFSEAFGRLAQRQGLNTLKLWRRLRGDRGRLINDPKPRGVASFSWNPQHVMYDDHDDPRKTLFVAEADPRVVVGVSLGRERHPMLMPFHPRLGPGHNDLKLTAVLPETSF